MSNEIPIVCLSCGNTCAQGHSSSYIDFSDSYTLQKTIVSCYKSLFGSKCVLSKRSKSTSDRDKMLFKFDKDIIQQDEELFQFRKKNAPKPTPAVHGEAPDVSVDTAPSPLDYGIPKN